MHSVINPTISTKKNFFNNLVKSVISLYEEECCLPKLTKFCINKFDVSRMYLPLDELVNGDIIVFEMKPQLFENYQNKNIKQSLSFDNWILSISNIGIISQFIADKIIDFVSRNFHDIENAIRKLLEFIHNLTGSYHLNEIIHCNDILLGIKHGLIPYVTHKSAQWMDNLSCMEYLMKVEKYIHYFMPHLDTVLRSFYTRRSYLLNFLRQQLLKTNQMKLLSKKSGLKSVLENNEITILYQLYLTYKEIPFSLENIASLMKQFIYDLGSRIIQESNKCCKKNKSLSNLHNKCLLIIKISFENDTSFKNTFKESFEEIINKEYFVSHLLAKYSHEILSKNSKLVSSDEICNEMDSICLFYSYIRDKYYFEQDYQIYFAHRLLKDLSISEQYERLMIGKLKLTCGYHWTDMLEKMLKDIHNSKLIMSEFNETKSNDTFDTKLNVTVCEYGSWPSQSKISVKIPTEVKQIGNKFKSFYSSKYPGRVLNYVWGKGRAELLVNFNPRTQKILNVSTYQMLILLKFNKKKTLTFKQILDNTNIPREDCRIHLLSMIHPKVKVMRKIPNIKTIKDFDKLQINPKYSNPKKKIIVPIILSLVKDEYEDKKKFGHSMMHKKIMCHISKIKRTLTENNSTILQEDLVNRVIKSLKIQYHIKPKDVIQGIEQFIASEYLQRDAIFNDLLRRNFNHWL